MRWFGAGNARVRNWMCILAVMAVAVSLFDGLDGNAAVVGKGPGCADRASIKVLPVEEAVKAARLQTALSYIAAADPGTGLIFSAAPGLPAEPEQHPAWEAAAEPEETGEPEKEKSLEASVTLRGEEKNARISWSRLEGADFYSIYRSSTKDGIYEKIADQDAGCGQYIDKTVKRGNRYYYRVTARMEDGVRLDSRKLAFACPLHTVGGVSLIRYSTSSVKVVWNRNKKAACYKVYYGLEKSGKFKLAGRTEKNWYRVKELKNNRTYYFRVKACSGKKASKTDSGFSAPSSITMRDYERTTVFAGDSITTGLDSYGILDQINIGGNKNVVASIGLNTTTFRTRREFAGVSALGKVIAQQPYRVYLMIGTNEVQYREIDDIIDGYQEIVQSLKEDTPGTDVVLLAVPPVTKEKQQESSGFAQIPSLNGRIKAMAAKQGVHFYDHTQVLKDADGCLQSGYAAKDGIHWTIGAYRLFAKQIEKYDISLD